MKNLLPKIKNTSGFTLVELLVVIAVLGVLAAGVLVAIDPFEQLQRGRDSGRRSAITELGRGAEKYNTSQTVALAHDSTTSWMQKLLDNGDIKVIPVNPSPSGYTDCATNNVSDYCFTSSGAQFMIFARGESKQLRNEAPASGGGMCPASDIWIVYSSALGRTGLLCKSTAPAIGDSLL